MCFEEYKPKPLNFLLIHNLASAQDEQITGTVDVGKVPFGDKAKEAHNVFQPQFLAQPLQSVPIWSSAYNQVNELLPHQRR